MKRFYPTHPILIGLFVMICLGAAPALAQETKAEAAAEEKPAKEYQQESGAWFGLYTKYRIGKKLYYYGEYHVRRKEGLSDMQSLYLRMGLSYIVNPYFEVTAGIVHPYYWAPDQNREGIDKVVPQYRGWQQFLFIQKFPGTKLYHRIRTEQRFKRDFAVGSPYKLTHRFRYQIGSYIPLNAKEIQRKTLFIAANAEVFVQAGKSITYNYLEDVRLCAGLGYVVSNRLQVQMAYQKTFGQLDNSYDLRTRDLFRLSFYHDLDLRRNKE